ncbi:MAG: c-type cytochrome [Candidatus Nitrohelix vancouverensis]|uniref:C-type cytochrome n=1 Tax=Candidatus Nitrohelix vancouverensis TaxID=2705534 RepID=A0A7T0G278_9BACT|nr:MAG: c-type cytochrome [Candidatus Nitrohelix vancouverensis]
MSVSASLGRHFLQSFILCGILVLTMDSTAVAAMYSGAAPAIQSPKGILLASGICPQNRETRPAPRDVSALANPALGDAEAVERGKRLYYKDAKPTACRLCHGNRGNGNGSLAPGMNPPPRNFTCVETMRGLSDGQMFWIIQNGSRGTAMPPHKATLSDGEIWDLIEFIKSFGINRERSMQ